MPWTLYTWHQKHTRGRRGSLGAGHAALLLAESPDRSQMSSYPALSDVSLALTHTEALVTGMRHSAPISQFQKVAGLFLSKKEPTS